MIFNTHEFRQRKKRERLEQERRARGTLKAAYAQGARAALAALKLGGAMGTEPGVQPKGPEQSHGTACIQYPPQQEGTSAARAGMPDWLWNNFTTYDRMASGRADGTFGQEVIG